MPDMTLAQLRSIIDSDPMPAAVEDRRAMFNRNAEHFPLPGDIAVEALDGPVRGEWLTPPNARAGAAILFLHGGGYMFGSPGSHRHLAAEIGRAAGSRVLLLDFRQAPEAPFPAAVEDGVAAYRLLLEKGEASRIAFVGDSAGGGLAVALMIAARDAGLPQPAAGWIISPWTDMEVAGASFTTLAGADVMVSSGMLREIAAAYLAGADPRSPLASPLHGDLSGLPPLLVHVGATEVLLDDSVALARAAGIAGVPVRLEIWPEMFHVWHNFHPIFEPARRAIAAGGDFIRLTTA